MSRAPQPALPEPRRTFPARLFWRVYLSGILLLVLVAVAVGLVVAVFGRAPQGPVPVRFAEYVALRAGELEARPEELARELQRLRDGLGAEATLYDGTAVVASSAAPPLPALGPGERARLARGAFLVTHRPPTFAAAVPGGGGSYVLIRHRISQATLLRGATLLAAILVALALASAPLAHAIAAPIERLQRTVRAFGAGDLSSRAGVSDGGEVGALAAAFDDMAERIERLVRGEKELLANVSHELRTPLSRIRVALDLAAEGDEERSRRYLAEIATDLDELDQLIRDVLTAARLELTPGGQDPRAGLPLRLEELDARELVDSAAERFRARWPGRSLRVERQDALPRLRVDPSLLRRALENLLDNARKYSDDGEPIVLGARADGGTFTAEVRDRGIGMSTADLARVFTPFFRSDASRARDSGGVGLGLALARRIVEAHGGRVELESALGEGTTVRLSVSAISVELRPSNGSASAAPAPRAP